MAARTHCLHLGFYSESGLMSALKSIHLHGATPVEDVQTREHIHDFYELVVVVQGDGYHYLDGTALPISPGQVYLVPPGRRHYFGGFQKIVLQNYLFGRKTLGLYGRVLRLLPEYIGLFRNAPVAPLTTLESAAVSELDLLQNSIAIEDRRGRNANPLLLFSYLGETLGRIFDGMANRPEPDAHPSASGGIAAVASYMRQNYAKEIHLPELARIAHLSVSAFLQHFRQEFHTTPAKWLTALRLRHSMKFLMQREWSVADTANACGFRDPLYFTRQFHKYLGCTPSEYRRHGQGLIQRIEGESVSNDLSLLLGEV